MPTPAARGRLRRVLTRIGAGVGLGAVFAGSLVGGALLHLNTPVAHRTSERILRNVLDGVFEGTVDATGFEHLGLDGVTIGLVVVHDPSGIEVLRARNVRAEATVPTILRNLLLGSGDLHIDLSHVRIEQVDVRVEPNAQGAISIAAAFSPRVKEPAPPPGRPVFLSLDHVEIGHGYVLGKPDGVRPLDADVRRLRGSVKVEPGLVAVDVDRTGIRERGLLPGVIAGTAEYHLRVFGPKEPTDTTTPSGTRMWATYGGRIGQVGVVARGLLEGDHVELSAHAPRAQPEHVKALVPAYPLDDTVALDVDVEGDLPRLDVQIAALTENSGSASVKGWVDVQVPLRAELAFQTRDLDPHAAAPEVPSIRVTSEGKVRAEIGPIVSVRVDARTEPTRVAGTPIPAVEATAIFDGAVWSGSARIAEPGAPTSGTFSTTKDGAVQFDVTAKVASLAKVPRIPRSARLSGAATVHATGQVRRGVLDANVQADVHGFRAGPSLTMRHAAVRGRVHGPLGSLVLDATVDADSAVAGGYGVQQANVRLTGPVLRPHVRARLLDMNDNQVTASAVLDPRAAVASRIQVRVERDGAVAAGEIARIGARGGSVHIDGVALSSPELGDIHGSLAVQGGELVGDLHAKQVNLGALRTLLGLTRNLSGKADLDISLARAPGGRKGTLRMDVTEGAIDAAPGVMLTGLAAGVDATFDGDRVALGGEVSLTGTGDRCGRTIATVRLSGGEGRIEGPMLDARTWAQASGRVDVAAEDLDLGCLSALVPVGLPVTEITGILTSKATLERDGSQRFPTIRGFKTTTRYLSVVGPEPFGADSPAWTSRDLDVEMTGELDGATGETTLSATFFDHDRLAEVTLAGTLDLDALADPRRRAAAARTTPVAGHLHVPKREIDQLRTLPSFLRENIPAITGEMLLDAYFAGTAAKPRAVVRVTGESITRAPDLPGADNPWAAIPVGIDAFAYYDSEVASLDAHVLRGRTEVLVADAAITAPIDKIAGDGPLLGPWITGSAHARLERFPLDDLPVFGDRATAGHLSGFVALEGLGKEPSLHVALGSNDLTIGPDVAFREATVDVRTHYVSLRKATATATVRFRERDGGALDVTGEADLDLRDSVAFTKAMVPAAEITAKMERFPVASAEPILLGAVRQLGGFVDGDAKVAWGRPGLPPRGIVEADVRIEDGAFYLPQVGQRFRLEGDKGGPLHVVVERSGAARIEHIVLEGNSGHLRGHASAQLEGVHVQSARAELTMTENDPLPITLEGVELGQIWGTLRLDGQSREDAFDVTVKSSDLHLKIPSSSSRNVQPLDPNPDITISHQPRPPPPDPNPGRPLQIMVDLDDMVIEGEGIHITLSSDDNALPTILLGQKAVTTGVVRITRGTVEVMGRKFEIEQGQVTLNPADPGNPYINVTAGWDAPDASRIHVDYIGNLSPITRDKLRFRSNPPRSQQETMALLLFGSETGEITGRSDATTGTPNPLGETAMGIGSELAAQQFNTLLKGIAPLKGLSTRFTAGQTGIKSSLVYQVGDTVSAVASFENGVQGASGTTTTGGAASSSSGTQAASVSIDWRFYKNWLIRAAVGTVADMPRGEIDLLWQYRY